MKKLLVATSNPGKLQEIRLFLSDTKIAILSLGELDINADAPETGKSFAANAIMKARYYCRKSGLPTIADDGGFEIDALHGEPGIHSHRWIHKYREDSDSELIAYTFRRMKAVPEGRRGARLRVVIAMVTPAGDAKTVTAVVEGIIPDRPSDVRTNGFPYRSILFLPEIGKYYNHDLLTPAETERFNHRKQALDELKPFIRAVLTI